MEQEMLNSLALVRFERAQELVAEAKDLLSEERFKSANNRAYYAIEKCIKAVLATKGIDSATHNGILKQFNLRFIHEGDGFFTPEDYRIIAGAEQIRNASDYDDFYIASKAETMEQVNNSVLMLEKAKRFLVACEVIAKERDAPD